jgi:hypothetical protein
MIMTRYYLDTEFIDDPITRTIELISIGMVCEDGRELYLVSTEFDVARCDDWLKANVLNQLPECLCEGAAPMHGGHPNPACRWRSRTEIREAVREFIREEPKDQIEIWAYFASYDWICLAQLFGKMIDMPKYFPFFVRDLKTHAIDIGYKGRFKDLLPDTGHHDALCDARWNRDVHVRLHEWRHGYQQGNALTLVDKLLDDLNDRSGFSVDSDIRGMIRPDWIKLITETR